MKLKVDVNNVSDEYKPFVKENMTTADIGLLGKAIVKNKLFKLKERFRRKRKTNLKKD